MIKSLRGDRKGFTLVELLVVIVILGILIAIAVPTFLNQQEKAQDSEAEQNLSTAYKIVKAEQATNNGVTPEATALESSDAFDGEAFSVVDVTDAASEEAGATDAGAGVVGVYARGDNSVTLVTESTSGNAIALEAGSSGVDIGPADGA